MKRFSLANTVRLSKIHVKRNMARRSSGNFMISSAHEVFNELSEYKTPWWCKTLREIPKYRIPLVMKPTPIHRWKVEGIPKGVELFVKRDDLNGSTITGNKGRNLEFLLAEAMSTGCSSVITCGTTFSNHCRSTVSACRQVGLDCFLIQRDPSDGQSSDFSEAPSGNLLLVRMGDPTTYVLPWADFSDDLLKVKSEDLAQCILRERGEQTYYIPAGGTNDVSLHAYLYAWEEMMQQKVHERFDDVVVTSGSGGTTKALAVANYLTGSKVRIHAFCASRKAPEILKGIEETLEHVGFGHVRTNDIIDVCDDYLGGGYGSYSTEGIAFCKKIAATTGIYCDPQYVGKSLQGLVKELQINPERFQGKKILFIHTGGIFGLMNSNMAGLFQNEVSNTSILWDRAFPRVERQ